MQPQQQQQLILFKMLQLLVIYSSVLILSVTAWNGDQITQQNIGFPDDSGSGASGSSSAIAPSSSPGGPEMISQQNIGIPGSYGGGRGSISGSRHQGFGSSSGGGYARPSSFRGGNAFPGQQVISGGSSSVSYSPGGGMMIPLAVNSRHMIHYVDVPSTMTSGGVVGGGGSHSYAMMGGGRSRRPLVSSSGGSGSSGFVPQQNIGIPGSYGGGSGTMVSSGSRGGVIQLPVHSRHTIEYVDVPSTGNIQPVSIEIPATNLGVDLNFRSSSNIKVSQSHQPSPGSYQETSSVDEPIRLSHTVRRPIIQELRETIQPYRKVTQEIRPVQEEIRTIVAVRGRGGKTGQSYGTSGGGYSGSGFTSGGTSSGGKVSPGGFSDDGWMDSSMSSGGGYSRGGGYSGVKNRPSSSGGISGAAISPSQVSPGTADDGWMDSSMSSGGGYPGVKNRPSSSGAAPAPAPAGGGGGVPGEGSDYGAGNSKAGMKRKFYDGSYRIGQQKIRRSIIVLIPINKTKKLKHN